MAYCRLSCKFFLEGLVLVSIQTHTRLQALRHLVRVQSVAHSLVHTESFQRFHSSSFAVGLSVNEAQTVAIGETCRRRNIERVATYFLYLANILSQCFRRVGREDALLASIGKIMGISTIESLVKVGCEAAFHSSKRCTSELVGVLCHDGIQALVVCRHNILHIINILQSPFYLEGTRSRTHQCLKIVYLAHIFQRKKITLMLYRLAVGIFQIECHSAELGTRPTIG